MELPAAIRILHRTSKALASPGTFLDLDPATEAVQGFATFDARGRVRFGPTAAEVREAIQIIERELSK